MSDEPRTSASGEYVVRRIGWAGSHYGTFTMEEVGGDGRTGSVGGPDPQTMLGRGLPPGARLRVTVEVLDEGGPWEDKGPNHQGQSWRHCEPCADLWWTDERLRDLPTITDSPDASLVYEHGHLSERGVTYAVWVTHHQPGQPYEVRILRREQHEERLRIWHTLTVTPAPQEAPA